MINRICLLLEALSIVICLHHLYGEKFKLDIKTVGFLAVDMILMTFIEFCKLPAIVSLLIYPIIAVYCGMKFGFTLKKIIVNEVLCVAIVGGIQAIVSLLYHYMFEVNHFENIDLLLVNCLVLVFIIILFPASKISKNLFYMYGKGCVFVLSLTICTITILFCLINYKFFCVLGAYQYIVFFFIIVFICILTVLLGKYMVKSKETEVELKMSRLYASSFEGLIEHIRIRQHEFDNHINTIYSQHFLYDTYEGLVNAQKGYCESLMIENRYNKLLQGGDPVILGFLYMKFIEIEKMGIAITYLINIDKLDVGIPVYKIVEVLGDIINNAAEAMIQNEYERKLYVSIIEAEHRLEIEIRNTSELVSREDIHKFFDSGYSKKGNNRGLGLFNVKKICQEYGYNVMCDNKNVDGVNWLSFFISK